MQSWLASNSSSCMHMSFASFLYIWQEGNILRVLLHKNRVEVNLRDDR